MTGPSPGGSGGRTRAVAALCRRRGLPLASRDDATPAQVEDTARADATIGEFPATLEAAAAARAHGLIDILSSDYYPLSLLHAAWLLHREEPGSPLAEAIATASAHPAGHVGLDDRGEITPGLRADLVRVHDTGGLPLVRAVWRRGERVA